VIGLVQQRRAEIAEICQRYHVERLELFGSGARDDFDPGSSDLDFLVTLKTSTPGEYADDFLGLANALEFLFERKVDLVTERSIRNPYFRQGVNDSRELVYEHRSEKAAA
jgi:predicted nucleotidyltransferase